MRSVLLDDVDLALKVYIDRTAKASVTICTLILISDGQRLHHGLRRLLICESTRTERLTSATLQCSSRSLLLANHGDGNVRVVDLLELLLGRGRPARLSCLLRPTTVNAVVAADEPCELLVLQRLPLMTPWLLQAQVLARQVCRDREVAAVIAVPRADHHTLCPFRVSQCLLVHALLALNGRHSNFLATRVKCAVQLVLLRFQLGLVHQIWRF